MNSTISNGTRPTLDEDRFTSQRSRTAILGQFPLNSVALETLGQLRGELKQPGTAPVFPTLRGSETLQGSRGWFPTALEETKIKAYCLHCNRHTFASRLVMAGVDLRTVAELLGHRTLQMVMRYSHRAPGH